MRLNNIRMINSGNFSLANLLLDADSIQLAGRNNKGKTSLLWTLLLLFVVDRKQATHSDYQLKESLHFYFRDPDKSYIVFEGFDERQGYFYMLLKRDSDTIKYYFVKGKFEEEYLIRNDKVLSFQEVLENPETGIGAPLKDITEILAKTITSKKGEVGFLRLENKTNSKRFSQLYKHLFRVSKNDDDLLKNGILVVLGLQNEQIDFGNEIGHDERAKWNREKKELEGLKKVKAQLDPIKGKRDAFENAKVKLKSEVVKHENIDFRQIIENTKQDKQLKNEEIQQKVDELKSIKGKKDVELSNKETSIGTIAKLETYLSQANTKLEEALSYGEEGWVKQEIKNATEKREAVNKILKNLDTVASKEEIETKLKKTETTLNQIKKYIENQSDLLLMNISDSKEDIALANTLLSDEVKTLHKDKILSPMSSKSDKSFSFNGSTIDIGSITINEVPTREEKIKELKEIQDKFDALREMKKGYDEKEHLLEKYNNAEKEADAAKRRLIEIHHIEKYKKEILALNTKSKEEKEKQTNIINNIKTLVAQESTLLGEIQDIKDSFPKIDSMNEEVGRFYLNYISACRIVSIESSSTELFSIEDTYTHVQKHSSLLNNAVDLFQQKDFELEQSIELTKIELRGVEIKGETPDKFIAFLDEKCYGLEIAEKDFGEMVKASFHIFFQRIKRFLEELDAIDTYTNQINRIISKYTISDLSNVKIIMERNEEQIDILKGINSEEIEVTFSFEEKNEEMMNSDDFFEDYLRKEKIIHLSDLFSINTEREKNDKKEASKQSNGTERMLHVMLLLILMREMINKEDTIPFLIDEVMDIDAPNQVQLLSFFKELNLLPISASPHVAHEFDKVYHIEEINGKSYLDNSTATWKVKENNREERITHV